MSLFLLPGVYTVSAEAPGFERIARRDVRVDTGARVTVDLGMSIGWVDHRDVVGRSTH